MSQPRFLRPAHLQMVGGQLWVVDASQPVAAVLDLDTGGVDRLVSWPQLPAAADHDWRGEWRVLSDGGGLWVQAGDGPVARVTGDGTVTVATVRTTTDTGGYRLAAAGRHGAWLVGPAPLQDIASSPDAPPPGRGWSRLLVAAPDGSVTAVTVQAPVVDVVGTDAGVYLLVESGRGTRRDLGVGHWDWVPEPLWLRVPWSAEVPTTLTVGSHLVEEPPVVPSSRVPGRLFMWHPSTDPEDPTAADPGADEPAGAWRWRLGWDRTRNSFHRVSVATGHDPATGAERGRVALGEGSVRAVRGTRDALWVAVGRPREDGLFPHPGAPAAVLRVDPAAAVAIEILPADSVDVSAHRRPLGAPPADADSYARYWLRYWAAEDGTVRSVSTGMTDGRAELVGEWPRTAIEVTFDWVARPGRRLRRRLPLFDELGRHTPPEDSDIHLTEDLATGGVPTPPDGATGGFLDL